MAERYELRIGEAYVRMRELKLFTGVEIRRALRSLPWRKQLWRFGPDGYDVDNGYSLFHYSEPGSPVQNSVDVPFCIAKWHAQGLACQTRKTIRWADLKEIYEYTKLPKKIQALLDARCELCLRVFKNHYRLFNLPSDRKRIICKQCIVSKCGHHSFGVERILIEEILNFSKKEKRRSRNVHSNMATSSISK